MRDYAELAVGTVALVAFVAWGFKQTEHFSDNYMAWDCGEEDRDLLRNKAHEVNDYIAEIECLQNNRINHPDLFGPNLTSLRNKTLDVFNQIRTVRKANKLTAARLYAINQGIETIKEKLTELQGKDKDIESHLSKVPKGQCLVITRSKMGRLFYTLETINAHTNSEKCFPMQEPTCSPCTISYGQKRAEHIGYPFSDPLFLPEGATPSSELTWAGNRI